jgi:hypothetical protein
VAQDPLSIIIRHFTPAIAGPCLSTMVKYYISSPRRLHLRLVCRATGNTPGPAKDKYVWPALPLVILGCFSRSRLGSIIVEHRDRVYQIDLDDIMNSQLERMATAMQELFPELMDLRLSAPRSSAIHSLSRFVLGSRLVCPKSTIPQVGLHSISGITNAAFYHHSHPCAS